VVPVKASLGLFAVVSGDAVFQWVCGVGDCFEGFAGDGGAAGLYALAFGKA
jgi:hypothetical protein